MTRLVLYVAHPLRVNDIERAAYERYHRAMGTPDAAGLRANLERAMRWLSWLRRSFPETTFIAPWIAAVLSGEDDADPAQREAGLVDDEAVVARCDGVVLCGGRISSGMAREAACSFCVWDLTHLGNEPRGEGPLGRPFEDWADDYRRPTQRP